MVFLLKIYTRRRNSKTSSGSISDNCISWLCCSYSLSFLALAIATLIVGVIGFAYLRGWSAAFAMAGTQIMEDAMNYNLSVIPLFILMGVFIYKAEISNDLFDAAYAGLGQFRGGLALSTVVACAGFSAVCGSSLATAATMTKVSMPAMKRYKYSDSLAQGLLHQEEH